MTIKPLISVIACMLPLLASAGNIEPTEDAAYFEATYGMKIRGLRPRAEYKDPDQYYTQVATQLDIPTLAYQAVSAQAGWTRANSPVLRCIVRRAAGRWTVLVLRVAALTADKKFDFKNLQQRYVKINDARKVIHCGEAQAPEK